MQVQELRDLAKYSRTNKNYQHRNLSDAEIAAKAKVSFKKLTNAQIDKVSQTCEKYGITDPEEIMLWRFMAQTNLFFLCKLLEKYKDVSEKEYVWTDGTTHNTHEEICNEFFVRKDPSFKTFKQFATQYSDFKERLLLVPRGGFKSSIDMADVIQWIICFPEVTILILTGVLGLAQDFVGEIKGHFQFEDGLHEGLPVFAGLKNPVKPRTMQDDSTCLFQVLFPEHCVAKEEGKQYEFQTPAAKQAEKECTVFAASIDQNLSGWHVGVQKLDDVVTNENSRTVDRIKNINKQVSINNAMLHPYGFYDKIGTWYDSEDTYGQDMKHIAKCIKNGDDVKMKVYLRAAWWANLAAVKAGKIEEEMIETDYDLWFNEPGQLTFDFLKGKSHDQEGFAVKYLNDPTKAHRIKFPRELLLRRTITSNLLPQQGMIVTCIDTAYSTKSWADYTVIITALIYGGRFYVIDMKRGQYNEYELPMMIAMVANQWKPKRISIEDSVGVKWLGKEIYREMDKLKIRVPIEFVPLGQGGKGNQKDMKAKPVLRLLGDERLLFANQCVGLEELYSELEKFGTAAGTHDDIVSALSILVDQYAAYADMEGRNTAQQPDYVVNPAMKQHYDMLYGQGVFSKVFEQKSFASAMENPDMSAQQAIQDAQANAAGDFNPLGDLFG